MFTAYISLAYYKNIVAYSRRCIFFVYLRRRLFGASLRFFIAKEGIMKKAFNVVIAIIFVLSCVFSLGLSAFAESENVNNSTSEVNPVSRFPSDFLGKPSFDMDVLIKDLADKEMSKDFPLFSFVDEYTCDADEYLVVYMVNDGFWRDVKSFDYNGISDALNKEHPAVNVPVFADVTDKNGNTANRQIGNINVSYDWSEEKYVSNMNGDNAYTFNYNEPTYSYEKISVYLSENKIIAKNVFIISYFEADTRCAAVVQTENDAFVLDITNSAQPEHVEYADMTPRRYSISEYANLRIAAEERMDRIRKKNNLQALIYYRELFEEKLGWIKYVGYAVGGIIALCSIAVFVIIKLRKRSPKRTEE